MPTDENRQSTEPALEPQTLIGGSHSDKTTSCTKAKTATGHIEVTETRDSKTKRLLARIELRIESGQKIDRDECVWDRQTGAPISETWVSYSDDQEAYCQIKTWDPQTGNLTSLITISFSRGQERHREEETWSYDKQTAKQTGEIITEYEHGQKTRRQARVWDQQTEDLISEILTRYEDGRELLEGGDRLPSCSLRKSQLTQSGP